MNAFMIFARRRRPQVSAANQTMRTGDISKILSKEWNSMDMVNDLTVAYRIFLLTDAFEGGQAILSRSSQALEGDL
jgi:HMG (high mobility group) box protein